MPEVFPDATHVKELFDANESGAAFLTIGEATISFTGLKPLPPGSRYFIVLDATPVPAGPDRP